MLHKMFANLKSKIKEETGNDVSKLTSVWSDKVKRRDSQTPVNFDASHSGDSVIGNAFPEKSLENIDSDMKQSTDSSTNLLEERLKERDNYWKAKLDELQIAVDSAQGEEARAAVAVARGAQAELSQQATKLEAAEYQLNKLREQVNCSVQLQDKLESLLEEFDSARREWSKERAELRMSLGAAEAEVGILRDELVLVRAALPPSHSEHRFDDTISSDGSEDVNRLLRERSILERQLQETRVALADIKTSWSGQIASLETQELVKQKNIQLKVESQEILNLQETLEERLKDVECLESQVEDQKVVLRKVNNEKDSLLTLLQQSTHQYNDLKRQYDIMSRDKDDTLLRNAHISQTLELSQCEIRNQESEIDELRERLSVLESEATKQKQELSNCMEKNLLIQSTEKNLKDKIQQIELQLDEKNKSIKCLQNRILDMKKTLQQEIQNTRNDISSTEDSDISRRYLKHVVMRFLTAKELEAKQLTRALSVLLRLNPQEEALLQSALPSRAGISNWFGGLSPT